MKYIKKEMPAAYKKWFDENNLRLQSSELSENEMFNKITAKLKRILERHLLKEQGHICAYCGKRIGKINALLFCHSFCF